MNVQDRHIPWLTRAEDDLRRFREAAEADQTSRAARSNSLKPVHEIAKLVAIKSWDLPSPPVVPSLIADFEKPGSTQKFSVIITPAQKNELTIDATYTVGFTPHDLSEFKSRTATDFALAALARPSPVFGEMHSAKQLTPAGVQLGFRELMLEAK